MLRADEGNCFSGSDAVPREHPTRGVHTTIVRHALLLAYHFPPLGGPTSERAVSLVRHLPAFGYSPTVVTGSGQADFWSPHDARALRRVPAGLRAERIMVPSTGHRRARVERLLALPTSFGRAFSAESSRVGRQFRGRVDIVICLFGPYELAGAAMRLARELDVPWIADLQDPWALDEMWLYPTVLHRLIDRRRMHRALKGAAAIVMNTNEAANRATEAFSDLEERRVHAIPNGFTAEDFPDEEPPRNPAFRIVHAGSMHTELGLRHRRTRRIRTILGGMPVGGVDFLTRSHVYLLEAVDRQVRRDPSLASELEVHLVGPLTDADRTVAARSSVVRLHGFLPRDRTAEIIRSADMLFLPMQNLPPGVRAGIVPTKAYEYAASGRPILAALPDGDARDFLSELGTANIVRPDDVDGMETAIAAGYARWRDGNALPQPNTQSLQAVEYRQIVRSIADVLDQVIARE